MEIRDKNIFPSLPKMLIPENMRDKTCYYAHHEDFGHTTNYCKSFHGQIVFTIKESLTPNVKRVVATPKAIDPAGSVAHT